MVQKAERNQRILLGTKYIYNYNKKQYIQVTVNERREQTKKIKIMNRGKCIYTKQNKMSNSKKNHTTEGKTERLH